MELTEIYHKGKEYLVQRKLDFVFGGVETGWVVENNRRVIDSYMFRQRCIDAPAAASTEVTFLGVELKTPVIMSAMTMPIPAVRDGGLMMVAEGVKASGSMMWTGTPIPENLAELVKTGVPLMQNVKPHADRKKLYNELDLILNAGVAAVGIEIDSGQGTKGGDRLMAKNCAPLSLKELREIRKIVTTPLIMKGVLSEYDAMVSLGAGADAIMVSNHGGRTIDYLPHPFQVAEEICRAVDRRVPLMMDSGFRRGSGVLKALALGATLVGLGRPILFGLAADGVDGVREVISGITEELRRIMVMVGAGSLDQIGPDCLVNKRANS
jgi:isopentenyl diphosphate isomerase/L-lactate dehydrogenase-like FMN-dependent dehydrogenase